MSIRVILLLVLSFTATALAEPHPGSDAFVREAAEKHGLDEARLRALLEQAEYKQSIVDAISRPAEAKPWYDYRPIFITDKRIDGGVEFWRENEALIERVSREFKVEPEVIVAIIGVETLYGRITGSYRVLDALATLGFHWPQELARDRSAFFASELEEFFVLAEEENLPPTEVTGSYAGAMGLGQFIPSSYRAYAVDFDGDGKRDLWRSTPDAVASVANYLARHGWRAGEPVALPLEATDGADPELPTRSEFVPQRSLIEITSAGYAHDHDLDPATQAAVLMLEERDGESHWLTFQNFYVITRYNRSPLYAMAVHQLAEAVREAYAG